ncbi:MAG: hypothetical protein DRJ38_01685 [Thermoprotei archaeon]|nr:MAG: hypothetical protein DRJ38_01685 [Thermoprotei archaeon]
MKIEDLTSLLREIILFAVFYISRKGNVYRAIRDLAEISSSYRQMSFDLRHTTLDQLNSSLSFKGEKLQLTRILLLTPLSERDMERYPIRILEEEQIYFNTYLRKLEDTIIFFTALAAFTPIFLSLTSLFGLTSYYIASLTLLFSMTFLNLILSRKLRDYTLDLKTMALAFIISTIGGINLFFYYKSSGIIHVIFIIMLYIVLHIVFKRKKRHDAFRKMLEENLTFEQLLLWTLERIKRGISFEDSLRTFLKENRMKNENNLAKWLFLRRHSLKTFNPLLDSINMLLLNSDWKYGSKQLENLVLVLRRGRIMLKELHEKMRILKYKADIICYISSATTALIFTLISMFKGLNSYSIMLFTSYLFSFFLFSLNLDLFYYRRSEALKKTLVFIALNFFIHFLLKSLAGFR